MTLVEKVAAILNRAKKKPFLSTKPKPPAKPQEYFAEETQISYFYEDAYISREGIIKLLPDDNHFLRLESTDRYNSDGFCVSIIKKIMTKHPQYDSLKKRI